MLSTVSLSARSGWLFVLPCLFTVGCSGSDDGGIKTYKLAYPDDKGTSDAKLPTGHPPAGGPSQPATGGLRILGAIYPADNPTWFFKITGPDDQLDKYVADFDKLIQSVKLQGDAVPTFTLPEGWTLGGPRTVSRGGVNVTFDQTVKFGPPASPFELTVSRAAGGVMSNVSRWGMQAGVHIATPADMNKYTKEFAADQVKGLRVDLRRGQ